MNFKFTRNKKRGRFVGICAGISDLTGISVFFIRFLWILSLFFSFSISFWLYLFLWMTVPARKKMSVPSELPFSVRQKLILLLEKLEYQEKFSNSRIVDAAEETIKGLIALAYQIFDISPLEELWMKQASKLEAIFDRPLKREDIKLFEEIIEEIEKNIELIEQSKRQQAAYNADGQNSDFKKWQDNIFLLRTELFLKTNKKIHEVFMSIEKRLSLLFPYLSDETVGFDLKYNINRTANNYLPESIQHFLDLSKNIHNDGKNNPISEIEKILFEQLKLLDNALEEMSGDIFSHSAEKMKLHGKFLEEKFAKQETFKID